MSSRDKDNKRSQTEGNPADHPLWRQIVRDVKPLAASNRQGMETPVMPSRPSPAIKRLDRKPYHTTNQHPPFDPPSILPDAPLLDRRTKRRLGRGSASIDRVIDLHGLSRERAYKLLLSRLPEAHEKGECVILVITGKGGKRYSQTKADIPAASRRRADFDLHEGILRKALPEWLNSPTLRPFIAAYEKASDRHGGAGAFYIRLKSKKQP